MRHVLVSMISTAALGRPQGCRHPPTSLNNRFLFRRSLVAAPWGLSRRRLVTQERLTPVRRGCRPTSAQASLQQLVSSAVSTASSIGAAAARGGGALQACLDPAVLSATVNASFKLFLICAATGWLLNQGKIPASTATVMSQVSFYLFIPAMLFAKVASTLSAQPSAQLLGIIVVVTLAQICLGAFFGRALAPLVDGQYSRDRTILGWHPLNPAKSAAAIAASVGTATGVPLAAQALLPRTKAPPEGLRELVALSAAFGNSFTLPAVFFMTLLPPPLADRALGYAAIFMLAWSPALWSIGYSMIVEGVDAASAAQQRIMPPTSPPAAAASASTSGGSIGSGSGAVGRGEVGPLAKEQQRLEQQRQQQDGGKVLQPGELRRIAAGPDWEVVERVPPAEATSFPSSSSSSSPGDNDGPYGQEPQEQQRARHHLAAFDRLMQYQLLRTLSQFVKQVLNPPVLGILAGMAVGLSPWGRALLGSTHSSGAAAIAGLPPELGLLANMVKSALEVVELMAGGTLAVQTLVLAASLLAKPTAGGGGGDVGGSGGGGSGRTQVWLQALRAALPTDAMEARALAVLSLTRFLLVPLGTLGLLWALHAVGALGAIDPVLIFVLLVESVMPSAQNLIILLQLSDRTRGAAPNFARMLLKLYLLAVLPVTLWVTGFCTSLRIPVVR